MRVSEKLAYMKPGNSWPPTTRKSNCESSPTTRKTPACPPPSIATKTSTRSSPARSSACRLTEVTSAQRRSAKAVNFGVIYGQSPFGLAKGLGISQEEAAKFIDGYFATYRGIAEFMVHTLEDCRRQGYVTTILGRRRAIQGVRPIDQLSLLTDRPSRRPLTLPERTAVNSVIQGSAADLIKLAMLAIHRRLQKEQSPAKMLLQIHDELVFEVPEDGSTTSLPSSATKCRT